MNSEEECNQHIANCSAFHAQFGSGAARAGLVSGFDAAVAASEAPRVVQPTLETACVEFAEALAPLVPVAMASESGRTMAEAVDLVSHLAGVLAQSSSGLESQDDFGPEELLTVSLGPFLQPLGPEQGKAVLTAVTRELSRMQAMSAGSDSATVCALLSAALPGPIAELRFCAGCGRSGGTPLKACSRCKAVRYCGEACQRKAWTAHKAVCRPAAPRAPAPASDG